MMNYEFSLGEVTKYFASKILRSRSPCSTSCVATASRRKSKLTYSTMLSMSLFSMVCLVLAGCGPERSK